MHRRKIAARSVWIAGITTVVWACGGTSESSTGSVCTPGSTQICSGPGACTGAQICNDDGSAWGACDCGDGAGGSGTDSGGTGGSAGSPEGGGGPVRVCLAGQIHTCTGPDDCAGVQVCNDDGTAYSACSCSRGGAGGEASGGGTGGPVVGGAGGTGGETIAGAGGTGGEAVAGAGGTGGEIIIVPLGGTSGTGGEIILLLGGTSGTGGFDWSECFGPDPPVECAEGEFLPSGPACGDEQMNQATEECDDGNTLPGDGCSGVCLVEPNWECPAAGTSCLSTIVCGDGELSGAEVCDDGNTAAGDGCAADCGGIESGFVCPDLAQPCISADTSGCGDGAVDTLSGEQCDDGVNDGGYGECASGCVLGPRCGDGEVQAGHEECDDGTNGGGYGECAPGCVLGPYCGDGTMQPGFEDCDDGGNYDGDGCSGACRDEVWVPL